MNIRLKENVLKKLLDELTFTADGCACGSWGVELDENLHIYVYRSCRKSSMTPVDKMWNVSDVSFYSKANYFYTEGYRKETYLDEIEVEEEDRLENIKLDAYQKEMILDRCREVTRDVVGSEFRSE